MRRNTTVRELSQCFAFCRFCDFSIYNSVRFIYVSVTHLSPRFFSHTFAEIPAPPFYLVMRAMRGILLILKGFFLPTTLPKLAPLATKILNH